MAVSRSLGKLAYGSLFVLLLPLFLVAWARGTEAAVTLPAIRDVPVGAALLGIGLALSASGARALWVLGGGPPMNAYPPPRLVTSGLYAALPHPIYLGFVLSVAGVSLMAGSASGLWLVTPSVALGAAALVWGYEREDLERRFGTAAPRHLLQLPPREDRSPRPGERIAVWLFVLLPWLLAYEAVRFLGPAPDSISAYLPFEAGWPVIEWTEAVYASTYLVVALAPLLARRSRDLRDFALGGALATVIGILLFLTLPVVAPPRPFTAATPLGHLLAFERAKDTPAGAFPSFHVAWALLAARLLARSFPRVRAAAWAWGAAVSLSCLTTGMHALADVLGGTLLAVLAANPPRTWEAVRSASQRFADSWRERLVGGVRLINHGLWAGLAGGLGLLIAATLCGSPGAALTIGLVGVLGAGLWAQLVEGSPRLARPFGYYGGVFGALAGTALVSLSGGPALAAFAAWAVAAPLVQAVGRLRCLVNGCCHGRYASAAVGIRYTRPRTRPCRIAGLEGVPLHPTQSYSILWNLLSAPLLFRLWFTGAPLAFLLGLYLLLNGLGRFVEEAHRGEPQTPHVGPLPVYQWLAIASALVGIAATTVPTGPAPPPVPPNAFALAASLGYGLLTGFAMGVDFPGSDRRFARLA